MSCLCAQDGLLTVVTYTRRIRDLFRKRYWLRCTDCDLRLGPFR